MAWLPRFDEKPFSLVASDPVTLMITAVGPFTNLLHELRPGDMLWIRGPFGNGFRLPRPGMRAAFVGGGYGVAPLLWLARAWRPQLAALTVIIGAGTAADLLYAGRFTSLQEAAQSDAISLELLTCTEDGSAGSTQAGHRSSGSPSGRRRNRSVMRLRSPRHALRSRPLGQPSRHPAPAIVGGVYALRRRDLRLMRTERPRPMPGRSGPAAWQPQKFSLGSILGLGS